MPRLTERDAFGNAAVIGSNGESWMIYLEYDELNRMIDAINKLADYEDTEKRAKQVLTLDDLQQMQGEPVWCGGASDFWALCWQGKLLPPSGERASAKEWMKAGVVFYHCKPVQEGI